MYGQRPPGATRTDGGNAADLAARRGQGGPQNARARTTEPNVRFDLGDLARDGREVDISARVSGAVARTVCYPPEQGLDLPPPRFERTQFTVENDDTLSAAQRLVAAVSSRR